MMFVAACTIVLEKKLTSPEETTNPTVSEGSATIAQITIYSGNQRPQTDRPTGAARASFHLQALDVSELTASVSDFDSSRDVAMRESPPPYSEIHHSDIISTSLMSQLPPSDSSLLSASDQEAATDASSVFRPSPDGLPSYEVAVATSPSPRPTPSLPSSSSTQFYS